MPELVSCVVIILSWIGFPVKGEERKEWFRLNGIKGFQSSLPVWGGMPTNPRENTIWVFQSTLPVWGGTKVARPSDDLSLISIHPPRVGEGLSCTLTPLGM